MSEPLVQDVSDTAFLIAHHRAAESARADALFVDRLAERLSGPRGRQIARGLMRRRLVGWMVAIRTRVIDDYIREAIGRGIDTVVNLGAGLDTRPYRLDLPPDLRWIEVDYPALNAFKEQQLAAETPRCRLERISLDLAQIPERRRLLAELEARGGRILVLTEGVIVFLDADEVGSLADDLRACSRVEGWIAEYVSPQAVAARTRRRFSQRLGGATFKFGPSDWAGFFAGHRWRAREIRYLAVEGQRWGRRMPLPWPVRLVTQAVAPLMSRERKQRFARAAGYAWLEPDRSV